MKKNVIVDIDGTIADISHRTHLIEGNQNRWHEFFKACPGDIPNKDLIKVIRLVALSGIESIKVHIFSGRSDIVLNETKEWLNQYLDFPYTLTMRKEGDTRPDYELKREMFYRAGLNTENTLCVFDDRKSVVDMWREEGLLCLQVADHNF